MKHKLIKFLLNQLESEELKNQEPVELTEVKKNRRPYGSVDVYIMGKWAGYIPTR